MNCNDIQYMMPLYLSGELDSATMARFESHADECPVCRREVQDMHALDRALNQALPTEDVDASVVQARVLAQIHQESRPRFWHPFRLTLAAVALLLCAALVTWAWQGSARYQQVSRDHANEVVMGHEQRWLTDEAAIRQMAAQRLSIQLQPQELNIPGYRLLRARRCLVGSHHYLHLVYGNGSEEMSMYILPQQDIDLLSRVSTLWSSHLYSRAESGYNVTEGDAKGWRVLLVGTADVSKQQAIISDRLSALS